MHRLAVVGAGLLSIAGFVGVAAAADLPARTYTNSEPMPQAVYNWTGFYVGANGGYGWGSVRQVFTLVSTTTSHSTSGGLAGGQIGYNWQVGAWVFGLEADGDWASLTGSALCPGPAFSCASKTRDLASFRGRVGWATGSVLIYETGGLGFANENYSALTVAHGTPFPGIPGTFNTDRWGYTLGAGLEYGLTPNWSAKLEYLHYGFSSATAPVGTLGPRSAVALSSSIDTLKVGVNYRFGGPIVAKY